MWWFVGELTDALCVTIAYDAGQSICICSPDIYLLYMLRYVHGKQV